MAGISWNRALCIALVAAALPGCGSCGAGLDELKAPKLVVEVEAGSGDARDPKSPERVTVLVPHDGDCVDLEAETAEVNGVGIPEYRRGGMEQDMVGETCAIEAFERRSPGLPAVDGTMDVSVSDGEKTFKAQFAGVCSKRTLSVRSPTKPLHPGDEVVLEWLPAGDQFKAGLVRFTSADGSSVLELNADALKVEGNRISFAMPEIPDERAGELSLEFLSDNVLSLGGARFHVPAAKCDGPSPCLAYCSGSEPDPIPVEVSISGASSMDYPIEIASSLHYAIASDDPAYDGSVALVLSDSSSACASLMANTTPKDMRSLGIQLFDWDGAKNQPPTPGEYQVGGETSGARLHAQARLVTQANCDAYQNEEATAGTVKVTSYDASGKLEGTFSLSFGDSQVRGRFIADSCAVPQFPNPPACQ